MKSESISSESKASCFIPFGGGKGGVGKTFVVANVAATLPAESRSRHSAITRWANELGKCGMQLRGLQSQERGAHTRAGALPVAAETAAPCVVAHVEPGCAESALSGMATVSECD